MVGYSGVIFGVFVFQNTIGDSVYQNLYGFRVRRIYISFIYLIAMSIMVPNAAFVGHLMGIMSGLLIKFCGFSCFLPG